VYGGGGGGFSPLFCIAVSSLINIRRSSLAGSRKKNINLTGTGLQVIQKGGKKEKLNGYHLTRYIFP
jgi:hypothetical protein